MSIPIAVLGMHRSGTSCLTGILEEAGLYLGDVSKYNGANRKGNQESLEVMRLHDDLLALNKGSWDDPPATPLRWDDALRSRRDAIIARFRDQPLVWGFKDPRTLLALDFWVEALPELRFVGTFRHPMAVARSLHDRSLMQQPQDPASVFTLEKGLSLWMSYNRRLLNILNTRPFPLLCFDEPEDVYFHHARSTCAGLGLTGTPVEFFDPALRHQRPNDNGSLGREALDLYDALLRHKMP